MNKKNEKPVKKGNQRRGIELFAGCGGLALGLGRAGFDHELLVELDESAVATLNENKRRRLQHFRSWRIEHCDSRDLNYDQYKGVALLSGGPPCQPFSIGGKHLGPKDGRNMWPEAIRSVIEVRPKFFVFENVRGLLRPEFAKYLEFVTLRLAYPDIQVARCDWRRQLTLLRAQSQIEKAQYVVTVTGVNAADYGAPQCRYRAVVVGIEASQVSAWRFPMPTHSLARLVWDKYVDGTYWKRHGLRAIKTPVSRHEKLMLDRLQGRNYPPMGLPWKTVRDAISDLPTPKRRPDEFGHWQNPGARVYPKHTGSVLDLPSKALKAGAHGVPGGENMIVGARGSVRYYTVREMARLQGFPDEVVILGGWKAATRQLGNAVPVPIGTAIGRSLSMLQGNPMYA